MKKSNIVAGIAAQSMLYLNSMAARTEKDDMETGDKVIQVYNWNIETELGSFTGTCLSMDDVNDEIALLTNNAKILKKNIIPVSLINEDLGNKVYTWNVMTNSGQASGVSVSLEETIRVINSFGNTGVVKSNITETFKTNK